MQNTEVISSSLEDYLEAIFHIVGEKQAARAKDIAKRLKVNNSSVTGALRSLAEKGMINYAPYDLITLTTKGHRLAEDVVCRHEVLRDFFVKVLDVNPAEAEEGACGMEHAVSRTVLDKLIKFIEFVEVCPRAGSEWIRTFRTYCDGGINQENCVKCTFRCLEDLKDKRRKETTEGKNIIALKALKRGQKGKIVKVKGRGDARHRIIEMGLTPGSLVEVERRASRGDPMNVRVKGYHLSLRSDEAERIAVEVL